MYILKSKDIVFQRFKEWKAMVEVQTGKKVKKLRTDNDWEFVKDELENFCLHEGIVKQKTINYTPQQNGMEERMNKTIL